MARTELMTEALCWDTDSKTTAAFANANKDFSYFCPHVGCLEEVVSPNPIVNFHFRANGGHAPECPNQPETKSTKSAPVPKKRKSIVPAPPIPTELGPGTRPPRKKCRPTKADLLALASTAISKPTVCAGTLEEVVDAVNSLSALDQPKHPLRIKANSYDYQQGFFFLRTAGSVPVTDVPFGGKVVYGAATISYNKAKKCFWVHSVKKFPNAGGTRVPLAIHAPVGTAAADYIKGLLPTGSTSYACTLFYSGEAPKLSDSGELYLLASDISDPHWRFILSCDEA